MQLKGELSLRGGGGDVKFKLKFTKCWESIASILWGQSLLSNKYFPDTNLYFIYNPFSEGSLHVWYFNITALKMRILNTCCTRDVSLSISQHHNSLHLSSKM